MPFDCKTIDLIYIERVRRGDERCAQAIEDVPALLEFCDKGNRWAAYALYQKYNWGDEKQGIFINRQKAPDRLVITSEADNGDPLLYALRQAYTNLDVEIKETEW